MYTHVNLKAEEQRQNHGRLLEDRNTEPETSAEDDLEDRNQREPETPVPSVKNGKL